ncbi:aminodeoxychorismate lyase [Algimonas ampicilliniresistens]|uniref:Endolytic murein transglycosylase n=1 Tax=Algimonas ampicilliniresistens TaxID=1298735 RepID=A0ABQ5VDS0_9PROT|nr:endolytic transglycosylase MltG [Algimonas ampicilliniresistens]GLQ24908.1 aminodeoxychorismate lyase [Algimonas ampicilliniresistens]
MARAPQPQQDKALRRKNRVTLVIVALGGLITLGIGLLIAGYSYLNYRYERAPDPSAETAITFDVPRGSGLSSIANRLEDAGLIDNADVFKLVTRMRGNEANFKAGEFAVIPGASMASIYDHLANGRAILYPFTAPEGMTSAQIVRALDSTMTLVDDEPTIPPEGTLLPETYLTPRGMTQSALLTKMSNAQTALLDELWDKRAPDLPIKTKQDAIILASVVEKETGIGMERDKVAGVFINRLRRGIRLQSDPTIIYGITQGEPIGRRIYQSEIDRVTDWNTYQIPALPKTPICNPGADAIRAVLNPAETDALFFVADGTGGHAFAATLQEHERNVAKWRKIQRDRGLR